MDEQPLLFQEGRALIVWTVSAPLKRITRLLSPGFAVMLPAFSVEERNAAESVVAELVELGCAEFCCVGPQAEQLHDAIDWVIEAKDALHVVTTWHEDPVEACEYFIHLAGGRPRCLLGLIEGHAELVAALRRLASEQ